MLSVIILVNYLLILNVTAITKLLCQLHYNQVFNQVFLSCLLKSFAIHGQLWFYSDALAKVLPLQEDS